MHELSLAGSILAIVEQAARTERFARVRTMRLSVPALAGVEVDALRFALAAVAPGTPLEAADVVIDEPPAHARCAGCGRACEVREHGAACPHCGGWRLEVTDGRSMRVVDLVVE